MSMHSTVRFRHFISACQVVFHAVCRQERCRQYGQLGGAFNGTFDKIVLVESTGVLQPQISSV